MSVRSPSQLASLFWSRVPLDFVRQMLAELKKSNGAADDRCGDLRPGPRKDTLGHMRRGCFETELYTMASSYPGAQAIEVKNAISSATHVRVRFGEVVITQHAVPSRAHLPRDADFRETMAMNAQVEMWEEAKEPPPGSPLYAMFLYESVDAERPKFATFVIPDRNCKKAVLRIDVTHLLNEIFDSPSIKDTPIATAPNIPAVIPEETIEDATGIKLRQGAKEETIEDAAGIRLRDATKSRYEEDMTDAAPPPAEVVRDTAQLSLFDWSKVENKPANDSKK